MRKEDGSWEKRPNWILVPAEDAADECWEKDDCTAAEPYPNLQMRTGKRVAGIGDTPWTTADGTTEDSGEDQSSVVHLAGIFVTQCSASSARRMTCNSREKMFFAGWVEKLEPPIGRTLSSWDDVAPREGGPTEEERKQQSDLAKAAQKPRPPAGVFDAGSSVGGSPRTVTAPQNNQTQTYQDVTGAYMLGEIKKILGQSLWMVFRFEGKTDWCLLCGKYASTSHLDTDM